jgi:hypothetical protein
MVVILLLNSGIQLTREAFHDLRLPVQLARETFYDPAVRNAVPEPVAPERTRREPETPGQVLDRRGRGPERLGDETREASHGVT